MGALNASGRGVAKRRRGHQCPHRHRLNRALRPHPRDVVAAFGDRMPPTSERSRLKTTHDWRSSRFVERANHPAERLQSVAIERDERIVSRRFEALRAPPRGAANNWSPPDDGERTATGSPPHGSVSNVSGRPAKRPRMRLLIPTYATGNARRDEATKGCSDAHAAHFQPRLSLIHI